jgi:hypothetical protein
MPGYIYGVRDNDLYVNLFASNTATIQVGGRSIELQQETNYPWDGDISIRVNQIAKAKSSKSKSSNGQISMMIRIPGWVQSRVVPSDLYSYSDDIFSTYEISVNGQRVDSELENGYFVINRNWKKGDVIRIHFDMPVRTVVANPRVTDDRGRIAVERGPLVYCTEEADNEGVNPHHLLLPRLPQFDVQAAYSIRNTEGDGNTFNVTAITAKAQEAAIADDGRLAVKDVTVKLIPYYAWNHRGAGRMDVWLSRSLSGLED